MPDDLRTDTPVGIARESQARVEGAPALAGSAARNGNETLADSGSRGGGVLRTPAERIQRQAAGILEILHHPTIARGDLAAAARTITQMAAEVLELERVSVWWLEPTRHELQCVSLFVRSRGCHHVDVPLRGADYPRYFAALATERAIAAEEACQDARTAELSTIYLQPLGIVSLLDAPIRRQGAVIGVVCHEHLGGVRRWQPDEIRFAAEVADQMAQVMVNAERQQAERELVQAKERAERLYQVVPSAIFTVGLDGRISTWNRKAVEVTGYSAQEMVGKLQAELGLEPVAPAPELATGIVPPTERAREWRLRRKDGRVRLIERNVDVLSDASGQVMGWIEGFEDITERRQAEQIRAELDAQVREIQKMEAIGTLAGGVAHDFNNILSAIIGNTELVRLTTAENTPVREHVDGVLKAAARAKDLVQQILAFSRRQIQQREPVQLQTVIEEVLKLLRASLPASIQIISRLEAPDAVVLADSSQIHQVMMNLCANASHAMNEGSGRLEVSLKVEQIDADLAAHHPGLHEGAYVRLSVADTGCGMDRATLDRIFEPFFTTKPKGRGTGLGLSVVHGIIRGHEGVIKAYSELGRGTVFHIFLPRLAQKPAIPIIGGRVLPTGNGERVLVVDDEPSLTFLVKRVLERLGYDVTTSNSSPEALDIFRAAPQQFDLVLTDQTMPGLTGLELTCQLLQIRPGIPIILATGYSVWIEGADAKSLGVRELLMKPMTSQILAEVVFRVLHGTEATAQACDPAQPPVRPAGRAG